MMDPPGFPSGDPGRDTTGREIVDEDSWFVIFPDTLAPAFLQVAEIMLVIPCRSFFTHDNSSENVHNYIKCIYL